MKAGQSIGDKPTAVWDDSFRLFGVDVRCHVLSDGTTDAGEMEMFARWQRGERLEGLGDA